MADQVSTAGAPASTNEPVDAGQRRHVLLLGLRSASTFLVGFLNEVFHALAQQASNPPAAPGLVFGMFFAAQQRRHHLAGVLDAVVEVNDLEGIGEVDLAHLFQARGAVNKQHHSLGLAHIAPNGFVTQGRTKVLQRAHAGYIGGRVVIPDRTALFVKRYIQETGRLGPPRRPP